MFLCVSGECNPLSKNENDEVKKLLKETSPNEVEDIKPKVQETDEQQRE